MHFHLPKPLHGWREFAGEVGIIVVGVLIALGAEQVAESLEWRHKVHASIDDMKQELGVADGPQSYARLAIHDCLASRLALVRQSVESGDREASRNVIDSIWLPRRTYDSFARDSAVASDVASHMAPAEMFNFRIVYALIPELNRLQDKELDDLTRLRALPATGGPLQQPEKLTVLQAVEALELDNERMGRAASFTLRHMRDVETGLDRDSVSRNIGEAREAYGRCLSGNVNSMIAGRRFDPW